MFLDPSFKNFTGHTLLENEFSLIYDVAGDYRVQNFITGSDEEFIEEINCHPKVISEPVKKLVSYLQGRLLLVAFGVENL